MASSNRSAIITKSHKVLKKHFKPVEPPADRTLLEHLLLACCLENSLHEHAEGALAILTRQFFDWNEVRVSARRELAEAMPELTDPAEAATRLRGALQSVFETLYSFDMEAMKKQNIGQAVKILGKHGGTTKFTVSYVTQMALGGHSIPLNRGALGVLVVIGAITEKDAGNSAAPGLERAISKSKGVEYASLLHQLGVQFIANPYSPSVRQILIEIAPDCKDRLPKRPSKKAAKKPAKVAAVKKAAASAGSSVKKTKAAATKNPAPKKKPAKKKTATAKKKVAKAATKKTATKKSATKKTKMSSKRLSKRKPR